MLNSSFSTTPRAAVQKGQSQILFLLPNSGLMQFYRETFTYKIGPAIKPGRGGETGVFPHSIHISLGGKQKDQQRENSLRYTVTKIVELVRHSELGRRPV